MSTDEVRAREEICGVAASLFARGLTAGTSGNISVRFDGGFLATPTNASLGDLDPARLSRLDARGRHLAGDPPTKEMVLHRAMYEARSGASAVVHLHSSHAAAVSCMRGLSCDDCLPPLTPYFVMRIGRLPLVSYRRPGDPGLAEEVRVKACRHCAVLLANHGPVVSGASLTAASSAIEELEETAKLFLLLRGSPVRRLAEAEIAELEEVFGPAGPPPTGENSVR